MMHDIKHSIKNPFSASITKVSPLNKKGSSKINHHVEISLEGSNIAYEVGCSFGLLPENNKDEIDLLLAALGVSKELIVTPKKVGESLPIYDYFLLHVNLHRITKKISQALLPYQKNDDLENLLENSWKEYTATHDLLEFLETYYNEGLKIDALVDILPPMLARFYSVASSQNIEHKNIHLLVADFSYKKGEKMHASLTAKHLCEKKAIRLFHQPNPSFYPPTDETPIIMVGPGTGLAAFKGFLQERIDYRKCKNNILFTGDRNKAFDFYYEEELTGYEKSGHLQLYTAFSRDSCHKVYVQDKMWEQKEVLFDLITEKKAHIFISGDADHMAKDVLSMLEKIYSTEANAPIQQGHDYIKGLKKEKRLHLDIY